MSGLRRPEERAGREGTRGRGARQGGGEKRERPDHGAAEGAGEGEREGEMTGAMGTGPGGKTGK